MQHGPNIIKVCPCCDKEFEVTFSVKDRQIHCSTLCYRTMSVKDHTITKEVLEELMPEYSWQEIGRMFNYSDNGIKKRAKALGCDMFKAKYKHKK